MEILQGWHILLLDGQHFPDKESRFEIAEQLGLRPAVVQFHVLRKCGTPTGSVGGAGSHCLCG